MRVIMVKSAEVEPRPGALVPHFKSLLAHTLPHAPEYPGGVAFAASVLTQEERAKAFINEETGPRDIRPLSSVHDEVRSTLEILPFDERTVVGALFGLDNNTGIVRTTGSVAQQLMLSEQEVSRRAQSAIDIFRSIEVA